MPAEDRLGLDDRDTPPPTRQQPRGDQESDAIEACEPWTSCVSTEDDDLVVQNGVLEEQITPRAEGVGERSDQFR